MKVDSCGGQIGMAKRSLEIHHVNAAADAMKSVGVTQTMRMDTFR